MTDRHVGAQVVSINESCDRCGRPDALVWDFLPCCPVPLCGNCAAMHERELARDVADGIITLDNGIIWPDSRT